MQKIIPHTNILADNRQAELDSIRTPEDTLQHVQQWMNLNHLKLNTDKTEFIYFGHYKQLKKCTVQEINVCENIVNRKESICYLGQWTRISYSKIIYSTLTKRHLITYS